MAELLAGTAYIDVVPKMDKFASGVQAKFKSIGDGLIKTGKSLTTKLTLPLVGFATIAVKEATEAAVASKKVEAALKSSGNAAVLTSKQIDGVATSIMGLISVDDDAIKATEGLLLQMTDLTGYGTKADDVLQMMTQTVYDMAAATNKSESFVIRLMASISNTPAKALTTLQKMNVITADQAEQFKKMADNGKAAEVSTRLLTLTSQHFSGAAAATVTPIQKLQVAFAQFAEKIGTILLPVVEKATGYLEHLIHYLEGLDPQKLRLGVGIAAIAAAMGPLLVATGMAAHAVESLVHGLRLLAEHPVIIAIIAIATAIAIAYKNIKPFRDWVDATAIAFKHWLHDAIPMMREFIIEVGQRLMAAWRAVGPYIIDGLKIIGGIIVDAAEKILPTLRDAFSDLLPPLQRFFHETMPFWKMLGILLGVTIIAAVWLLAKAFEMVANAVSFTTHVIGAFADKIASAVAFAKTVVGNLIDFFSDIPGNLSNIFNRVKDVIVNAFKSAVNTVIGFWNKLDVGFHFTVPDVWGVPNRGETFGVDDIFPDIPYLASGGIVRQPTLAMIGEAGPEAVVPLSRIGGSEAKFTITDWRRGLGTLEYELDRMSLVRGD